MEARLYTGKEPDAGRAGGSASVAVGHQRAWPMVERRRIAHERRLSEVRVRPHGAGFVAGNTATLLVCFMNRRMPNGTSGGVGGRREQSRLLPDLASRAALAFASFTSRDFSWSSSFCKVATRFSCFPICSRTTSTGVFGTQALRVVVSVAAAVGCFVAVVIAPPWGCAAVRVPAFRQERIRTEQVWRLRLRAKAPACEWRRAFRRARHVSSGH